MAAPENSRPTTSEAPWVPPATAVEVPGHGSTWVRDTGPAPDRPTVLLLHGWAVTSDVNWSPAYRMLAEDYRVVAVDNRGHGRGLTPPDGMVRLSDCADDADAVLDALSIGRAVVVGYSMGGAIAQLLWRRHPTRVQGLVLASTARRFRSGPLSGLVNRAYTPLARAAHLAPGPSQTMVRWRVSRRVADDPSIEWMRSELEQAQASGVLSSMRSLGRFDSVGWLGELDVPSAVIVTTRDRTIPPYAQNRLAASLPDSLRLTVDGPHDAIVSASEAYLPVLAAAVAHVAES